MMLSRALWGALRAIAALGRGIPLSEVRRPSDGLLRWLSEQQEQGERYKLLASLGELPSFEPNLDGQANLDGHTASYCLMTSIEGEVPAGADPFVAAARAGTANLLHLIKYGLAVSVEIDGEVRLLSVCGDEVTPLSDETDP